MRWADLFVSALLMAVAVVILIATLIYSVLLLEKLGGNPMEIQPLLRCIWHGCVVR
jgi:hypothetical protein